MLQLLSLSLQGIVVVAVVVVVVEVVEVVVVVVEVVTVVVATEHCPQLSLQILNL